MDSTEQDGGWFCVTKDACFLAAIRTYSTRPSGVHAREPKQTHRSREKRAT